MGPGMEEIATAGCAPLEVGVEVMDGRAGLLSDAGRGDVTSERSHHERHEDGCRCYSAAREAGGFTRPCL